jgi:hypothetical protein
MARTYNDLMQLPIKTQEEKEESIAKYMNTNTPEERKVLRKETGNKEGMQINTITAVIIILQLGILGLLLQKSSPDINVKFETCTIQKVRAFPQDFHYELSNIECYEQK